MENVAGRIPIGEFIDHGPNVQPNPATDTFLEKVYPGLYAKSKHTVVKPGDRIAMKGLDIRVVASAGQALTSPLPGAGQPNPYCACAQTEGSPIHPRTLSPSVLTSRSDDSRPSIWATSPGTRNTTSCARTIGSGPSTSSSCRTTVSQSRTLRCSCTPLAPRVAILNNGTRKGGQPDAMNVLFSSPGLEDLWQIHFSLLSGQEYTVPGLFIANGVDEQPTAMPIAAVAAPAPGPGATPPPVHNGTAYWIKVSARRKMGRSRSPTRGTASARPTRRSAQ